MEQIAQNLTTYMLVGIVFVVLVSQFHRLAGAVIGVVFWLSVAVVGTAAYDMGGEIGLGSFRFSRNFFYGFCGVFMVFNGFLAFAALKRGQRRDPIIDDD